MNHDIGKKTGILFLIVGIITVVAGIVIVRAAGKVDEPTDYSGKYTDKQGTSDIYSELELRRNGNAYTVAIGIYRLTTLYGTADESLHFASDETAGPAVKGDITIDGDTAEITITESDFTYIEVGETFRFPDGKEP